jgi:DNA-binding transcriptional regulator YdaS (Cro superfamily)
LTGHLYACRFSNSVVKVGRTLFPQARLAAHERRVACAGITLVERHTAACVGHLGAAERALIERCSASARSRNSSEWFEGLDFAAVKRWVDEFAATAFQAPASEPRVQRSRNEAIDEAIEIAGGPTALARALQERGMDVRSHATVNGWRLQAVVPADYCPDIEDITGVPCEALRPRTNWALIRNTARQQEAH